jgi:hypothetical protein
MKKKKKRKGKRKGTAKEMGRPIVQNFLQGYAAHPDPRRPRAAYRISGPAWPENLGPSLHIGTVLGQKIEPERRSG